MPTVNVFQAKTQLSKLIAMAENGEEVVIARAGKPVVRISKIGARKKKPLKYDLLKGKIWIADDFDDSLPEDFLITPEA